MLHIPWSKVNMTFKILGCTSVSLIYTKEIHKVSSRAVLLILRKG